MVWTVAGIAATIVIWSLVARRLQRWGITPVMTLVFAGGLVGFATHDAFAIAIDAHAVEPVIETILAIVLFEHAASIRGGFFGGQAKLALRMLFVALPISLAAAVFIGLGLLPGLSWPILLVMACVVVPIDFAPVVSFLHDERIPLRVRQLFNVEEGYADGVVAPVYLFALSLSTGAHTKAESVIAAVRGGLPHLAVAVALGLLVGGGLAWLANAADRRGFMTEQSRRVLVVGAPVLTYVVNVGVHGNGFVAAFVCGIAYNSTRRYIDDSREQEFIHDVNFLLTAVVWFSFGAVAWYVLEDGVDVSQVVFGVLVLTVVRAVPVTLVLLRSGLSRPERTLLAGLGPSGTASIALGLLAYTVLPDDPAETLLTVMVIVVLGSVLIHGAVGPVLVRRAAVDRQGVESVVRSAEH
ncbi:hypothetical protein B1R94_24430 [Mycolicibacterium litorale]|nr:hypothetical protein B1R94_24430 [Mycolicibacterium litorale]